ncbi:MAG TPA: UDP-3-O-acyl-N-acetylglucosamine deacetylase [Candidatus Methylomirabilis sp.]|nr:UDP-3-O-acyl-N-acetylglucosamine deacetylase [Candidatus Methylomirabilis sp.]
MRIYQRTTAQEARFSGVGLHTGAAVCAKILPAPPDTGIVFHRTDLGVYIPAGVGNVVETSYATVLASGAARLSTVEHFLSALYGMQVDNALVEVDGPEMPILDGSSLEIARAIAGAGYLEQPSHRRFVDVDHPRKLHRNGSMVALSPSADLELLVTIDFPAAAIGKQWLRFTLSPEKYLSEIAPARTFVLRHQIEALRAAGLARGGSLENAIVVEEGIVHNPGGLRFPDEFVRHKVLDFLGDMALVGRPVRGFFLAVRPGHTVNRDLVEFLSGPSRSIAPAMSMTSSGIPAELRITA